MRVFSYSPVFSSASSLHFPPLSSPILLVGVPSRCVASRPLSFSFPAAFAGGILFRKNTRESFEFVVVRSFLLDFPSSLSRIQLRLRSLRLRLKRTTSPHGHSLSLVYAILPWSHPAVSLFGTCEYPRRDWLMWLSFYKIRSRRLRQHLYLFNRSFTSLFRSSCVIGTLILYHISQHFVSMSIILSHAHNNLS